MSAAPESSTPISSASEPSLEQKLPMQETNQPDPMLQLSTGPMGAGGITIVAVAVAIILAIVFYGLNSRSPVEHTATAPPAAQSSTPPAAAGPAAATPSTPGANPSGSKG